MNPCPYLLKAASGSVLAARFSHCGMIACFPTKYVQTPLQGASRGGHPRDREFMQDYMRGLSASYLASAEHRMLFFAWFGMFLIFALFSVRAEPAGSGYRLPISFIDCAAQRVQSAKRHLVQVVKE